MTSDLDDKLDQPSIFSRWAERKAQVAKEKQQSPEQPAPTARTLPPAEQAQEELIPLPPLESLDENSDYRGFLDSRVSEDLHRLALRKLFHSPRFQILDGLNDYDEDYTHFAPLGDLITQEMRHRMEVAAKRLAEAEESTIEDDAKQGTLEQQATEEESSGQDVLAQVSTEDNPDTAIPPGTEAEHE